MENLLTLLKFSIIKLYEMASKTYSVSGVGTVSSFNV